MDAATVPDKARGPNHTLGRTNEELAATAIDAPSSVQQLYRKLSSLDALVEKGQISQSVVQQYFPGFGDVQYQGDTDKVQIKYYVNADTQYKNQDELSFDINVPAGYYFKPNEIELL